MKETRSIFPIDVCLPSLSITAGRSNLPLTERHPGVSLEMLGGKRQPFDSEPPRGAGIKLALSLMKLTPRVPACQRFNDSQEKR